MKALTDKLSDIVERLEGSNCGLVPWDRADEGLAACLTS